MIDIVAISLFQFNKELFLRVGNCEECFKSAKSKVKDVDCILINEQ